MHAETHHLGSNDPDHVPDTDTHPGAVCVGSLDGPATCPPDAVETQSDLGVRPQTHKIRLVEGSPATPAS